MRSTTDPAATALTFGNRCLSMLIPKKWSPCGRDEHVVDRRGQLVEESLDPDRIVGVQDDAASRRQLARRLLEPPRVAGREHYVGALAAGEAGGLETDARAAADYDDSLAEQSRLTRD
jgi:hypothetical protein